MASTFVIHACRDWTFQLVLLGSRLQLEGWCDDEYSHCSAWVEPTQTPHDVADLLMRQPSCCL
jgi:hypothetical protein